MTNEQTIALPSGYQLENYRLETVLGHGGFGITYRAKDGDLRKTVAIKEYLPREVAFRGQDSTVVPLSQGDRETFEWGLERFLDEARTLARFGHPNIVGVHRFLRTNGTAYLVMDYCEGESLESMLGREGTLAPDRLEAMLVPLLNALEVLHAAGVTHRDIKPGNIYLREDGSPVLLDFGAARQALAQHSRSVTAMATPGYAAFEQYSTKGKQGPWTDIYGLGATLYRCVTGQRPPDASDRMLEDELVPTVEMASGRYPKPLLQQIDAALKLRPQDRPQSIAVWRRFGVGSMASQPREREAVVPPVAVPQAPAPWPAGEPAATTGRGRGWLWLLIVGAVIGFFIWAGSEQPNPRPSTTVTRDLPVPGGLIESRYQLLGAQDSIVRDTVTELEWHRCGLGQTWDGSTCVGEAQVFTWEEARQVAERVPDWRLPTIVELKTLAYCSSGRPGYFSNGEACGGDALRPTIAQAEFPNTLSSYFWSGSPDASNSSNAWGVLFSNGAASSINRSFSHSVRLVRGDPPGPGWHSEKPAADTEIGTPTDAPDSSVSDPQPIATATRDSPVSHPAPPLARVSGPEMVLIRGGTFTMGGLASEAERDSEERQHQVRVGDVWIGKYAVTFGEYDRFARATGRDLPGDQGWGRGRRPVINVSWADATAYAQWLSGQTGQRYRLPTEAEWEYACRGGQQQRYCGSDDLDAVAWYSGNSGGKTQPVGGKQANRFGLYDMSGNVWEWTCSVFDAGYGGAEQRCDASGERRVLRGGSWYNGPDWVRSVLRFGNSAGYRDSHRGFRLARSP